MLLVFDVHVDTQTYMQGDRKSELLATVNEKGAEIDEVE